MRAPAIWVPVQGRTQILLAYNPGNRAANPQWLKEALGDRIQVRKADGGIWEVARDHSDRLLAACVKRFGKGATTVITDAAQQQRCGSACQTGKPENALQCVCQCGGENHGGIAGDWTLRDAFAIKTTVTRRVFQA